MLRTILALGLASTTLCVPALAMLHEGWWVVLGSFSNPDGTSFNNGPVRKTEAMAARCGFTSFNDFSMKFSGFAPGYDVVVLGAYATRAEAQAAQERVASCIPDAYVKRGRYLGE